MNGNYIELQQSFSGNFRIEVDIEKVGTSNYPCWDFYVELVALKTGGVIPFDEEGFDGINIGKVGMGGACGHKKYSMNSAGPNKGKVILEYKEPYMQFNFTNIDGNSLNNGKIKGTFKSTKIRIWLAGQDPKYNPKYTYTPRYIDNVKVYSLETLTPTPTLTSAPAPTITKFKKCVGDEPYLYVGDRIMGKIKTVKIPIIMCNAKDLANMDLDWSYDASVLKLIDVTKGSLNKKALFE